MIGERVPAWTALVLAQRRRKLEAYSPTDSVNPCWRLKNAPAKVEESRCSPQCCSRMAKILPGVLTSSAPMDSTSCLARPSSAPRSQAAAAGSAMGPSSRNSFASLTKSSAASPSSPENRRTLWGLKLWSVGGAGGWPGLSAVFMVKIGLCCCLCEDRSRVAAPLILLSQRQSCNGVEWSKDKTQAAESIKWRPQQAYGSNQFLLVQPQTVFSTHTKSSRSRIDKRTARATGNTRYRYSKIAPLDHKMADNCVSLARTNTLSSSITKPVKTSKTSNKSYSYHLLNRINKMYTHDLFYLQQEWEAWLVPVYIQIRTTKSQLTQCTKYKCH